MSLSYAYRSFSTPYALSKHFQHTHTLILYMYFFLHHTMISHQALEPTQNFHDFWYCRHLLQSSLCCCWCCYFLCFCCCFFSSFFSSLKSRVIPHYIITIIYHLVLHLFGEAFCTFIYYCYYSSHAHTSKSNQKHSTRRVSVSSCLFKTFNNMRSITD